MQEKQENFSHSINPIDNEEIILWLCFDNLSLKDLPQVRKSIQGSINDVLDVEREYSDHFMLAATEILSNLIQHGKRKQSYINIALYTENRENMKLLILDIGDNGEPIPEFNLKYKTSYDKVQNNIIHDDKNDSGRGMGIIGTIMDDLIYIESKDSPDGLNHIVMEKSLFDINKDDSTDNEHVDTTDKNLYKLFIIDDDRMLRKMLDSLLSKYYKTVVFASAVDALEAFEEEKPDLILSDLLMPEMNGAELREALSNKKNGDITPFIFLSGHPEEAEKDYVSKLGIDGFLNKSIDKNELLETIKRTIKRSQQLKNDIPEQIAKDITTALSPKAPPNTDKWRFAIKSAIAETGGGDLVMHYKTRDGIMVIFADVMGHGVSAKFFAYAYMGYLRSIIRMFMKDGIEPASLLNMLSKNIYEDDFLDECIFTCQAILLGNNGTIKIASAGHPWPIITHGKGDCKLIEISGTLPGMLANANYSQYSHEMDTNDKLILYTDGIIENISRRDPKKAQYLLSKNIRKYSNLKVSVQEMLDNIWEKQLTNFSKAFTDDTTMLAIEYTGK